MEKQKLRLGTVAFSPKGKWNAETEYKRLNVVHFLASSYYAKKDNVGQAPTLDSEYWGLLVEGGDIVNNPDEEDITTEVVNNEHVLKLADKEYRPENYSGKGYKRLRKNIQKINLAVTKITVNSAPTKDGEISVTINNIDTHISLVKDTHNTPALVAQTISDALVPAHTDYNIEVTENIITLTRKHSGEVASSAFDVADAGVALAIEDSTESAKRNILTATMINESDTIYEIGYNFDIDGGLISLPENISLIFNGGSFSNGVVEPKNCYIYSKFKSPIFIDIIFKRNSYYDISNELYDYYFKDTSRDDDYLTLFNLVYGNPAIITAPVLNIKTFVNPYYEQYKQYGVYDSINTRKLNLEGNNSIINILADLDTKERPFTGIDRWGINSKKLITINNNTTVVSVRNISFVDDKSINGYGADLTKTTYSYNGQEKNVRGWLIAASFDKLEKLVFENVNARTACELFGANSYSKSKSYINVLFNNVNVYSHTNFCIEIWGNDVGAANVVYNNCVFETTSACATSNSALESTFSIYRNCTFNNCSVTEVGSFRCENCLLYNARYLYGTTDVKIEIINCKITIDKKYNSHYLLFSRDFLMVNTTFDIKDNKFVTFRIASTFDNGRTMSNKVIVINTNLPVVNYSIDKEYSDSLSYYFEGMFKESPIFNIKNSAFYSSLYTLSGIFYNCGDMFKTELPKRSIYSNNLYYLNGFAKLFPLIYADNVEDEAKIVLDNNIVYSKKSLAMNFQGTTNFDKYVTIRLGINNFGNGSITINTSIGDIMFSFTRREVKMAIGDAFLSYCFPTTGYQDIAISLCLNNSYNIYTFINGEYMVKNNGNKYFELKPFQLNNTVDVDINGAGFRYMMLQPIMLYKVIF